MTRTLRALTLWLLVPGAASPAAAAPSPERFDVSMRTWAKKVLTVVIDADYGVEYRTLRPTSRRSWISSPKVGAT